MTWIKHNQTAYSLEGDTKYSLYHTPEGFGAPCCFDSKWHIVFWPEKGNGKPTVLGKLQEDYPEQDALNWADSIVAKHKG